jgi:hypothetical protein
MEKTGREGEKLMEFFETKKDIMADEIKKAAQDAGRNMGEAIGTEFIAVAKERDAAQGENAVLRRALRNAIKSMQSCCFDSGGVCRNLERNCVDCGEEIFCKEARAEIEAEQAERSAKP